jgi:Domain of unknown function (DUF4423)
LSLIKTKDYKHDPQWIGRRLRVNPQIAASALESLEKYGYIHLNKKNNRWVRTKNTLSNAIPSDKSTQALENIRKTYVHDWERSKDALYLTPKHLRIFKSFTFAIDESLIPKVDKLMELFAQEIGRENKNIPTEVYKLTLGFFPLSHPDETAVTNANDLPNRRFLNKKTISGGDL